MLEPVALPKSRLEAVTDGIFAVTMTLLVLDLRLPSNLAEAELWRALLAQATAIDDYVISFVVLCVFWIAHLRLLRRIETIDTTFTAVNLAFLLFTTFVPILTVFAGHNPGRLTPAVLYGSNLIAILATEMIMWRHALPALTDSSVTDAEGAWRLVRRKLLIAMAVVLVGMALAILEIHQGFNAGFASYTYLLLVVVGVVHPSMPGRRGYDKSRIQASAVSASRE
ncbi:MAG: TMEM175 family protein [Casimicrobiaceae bacterium]